LSAAGLKNGVLRDLAFKQIELNFQSLRFTSGYMHDFGGQAMYMQRIFRAEAGRLVPVALENTPDVFAVARNPALLTRFVDYLKQGDRLAKLDNGTLVVDFDPAFLTKFAISWSTLGRARVANRPYTRLFEGKRALLESIDIRGLTYIKSHDALVERLNNLTCMGCHQMSGTAGFHLLGLADDKFSHHFNRQQLPLSPHAYAEAARRSAYVEALAAGRQPNRFRPHSAFPAGAWIAAARPPSFKKATVGELCTTPSIYAGAPACVSGAVCQRTVTSSAWFQADGEPVRAMCAGRARLSTSPGCRRAAGRFRPTTCLHSRTSGCSGARPTRGARQVGSNAYCRRAARRSAGPAGLAQPRRRISSTSIRACGCLASCVRTKAATGSIFARQLAIPALAWKRVSCARCSTPVRRAAPAARTTSARSSRTTTRSARATMAIRATGSA
jgi:hypothetical protein